MTKHINFSKSQLFWLITLRVMIGWYFLYEGISKILSPNWSSYGYLKDSQGMFSEIFNQLTQSPWLLQIVDLLNMYGLVLVGLSLILGAYAKWGSIAGIILLALYYLSHPPLLNANYLLRPEGSSLWIDKNLIIMAALFVMIAFPTSKRIGLDRFLFKKKY